MLSESARPIAQVLRAGQQAGEVDVALDAELAARAYLAMEVGLLLWWLEDLRRADAGALVETLLRLHPAHAGSRATSNPN